MSPSTSASNEVVLRGPEAARALRIDLVAPPARGQTQPGLHPTGPWAADVNGVFGQARDEGYAAGHQEGWEAGMAQGRADARDEAARVAATVEALSGQVAQELARLTDQLARDGAGLALTVAQAILGREVACAADPGAEAIERALALAPLTGAVVARLHPDDLQGLGPVAGLEGRELTLVADASLTPGDAVVTVDDTLIDGRLGQALDRVAQVLS